MLHNRTKQGYHPRQYKLKSRKRKILLISLCVLFVISTFLAFYTVMFDIARKSSNIFYDNDGTRYICKVDGKNLVIHKNEKWRKEFIKGVNMGVGKPGKFAGDIAITKTEYLRWFKYISKMNANTIRVYTTLKPEFYDALYEFNITAKKPLYLIQGVWIDENNITDIGDAYDSAIIDAFKKDSFDLIDIIHGNCTLPPRNGFASGTYAHDVSRYVIGWILGIEWDPYFVVSTNSCNPSRTNYSGKYLYCDNASPFENFLCEVGDSVINYECEKYKMQRPISFANWPTTDPLDHPNEPLKQENLVSVDIEHIKPKSTFHSGVFASYHAYPYYPEFINYQESYRYIKDSEGKINTYRAYLRDLINYHTVPVMIAEFGVPSSRGKTHQEIHREFNQGNLSEKQQGKMDASLLEDIYEEGYCGGIVFTWQDEWFKRTWNTMDFDLPNRRPYWSNTQTCEQEFGLLAFDPGEKKCISYIDGNMDNWKDDKPLVKSQDASLYVKSDEKYVYFMADVPTFDLETSFLIIPIDIIPGQGNSTFSSPDLTFSRNCDFVIVINGKDNSRILVDSYYDSFYFLYGYKNNFISPNKNFEVKNNGIFNNMYLCLNRDLYLPQSKITLPFLQYETGKLVFGNGNPSSSSYNSLTDFTVKDKKVEIRIPWQLLNVMDPSSKCIIGNLYQNNKIGPLQINEFYAGVALCKKNSSNQSVNFGAYSWKPWTTPKYHERLKQSYYELQKAFKNK